MAKKRKRPDGSAKVIEKQERPWNFTDCLKPLLDDLAQVRNQWAPLIPANLLVRTDADVDFAATMQRCLEMIPDDRTLFSQVIWRLYEKHNVELAAVDFQLHVSEEFARRFEEILTEPVVLLE